MGGKQPIGTARLILAAKRLDPGTALQAAVELNFATALKPLSLTCHLQTRERTSWMEEKSVYNPIRKKNERIMVDVGTTDVKSLTTTDVPIHFDMQFPPGAYTYRFEVFLPLTLKPAVELVAGEASASFAYELMVRLASDVGAHCSTLKLPAPSLSVPSNSIEQGLFATGDVQAITFKPLLREAGELQVHSRLVKEVLGTNKSLEVLVDLDNSRNPYDITTAYFALERTVTLQGIGSNEFFHSNIISTQELSCLPVKANSFLQQYRCNINIDADLDSSFEGELISNQYQIYLYVACSGTRIRNVQKVKIADLTVLSENTEPPEADAVVPLVADVPAPSWKKWAQRAEWKDFGLNLLLGLILKAIEIFLKRK